MFAALRSRPHIARTPQPLGILSRTALLLNNGFSANSDYFIAPQQLIYNPQDSKYYLLYGTEANFAFTSGQWGLAQATSPDGPWTDLGALSGPPTGGSFTGIQQAKLLLTPDSKWSLYYVTAAVGGQIGLYQTAASAAINSTYTLTSSALLTPGTTGTWDHNRLSEPFVFKDQGGTWRMLYMGIEGTQTYEQVGLATSSGDHTGPWTKYASNPIIAHGSAGAADSYITADPFVVYYNGTYYIFHSVADSPYTGGTGGGQMGCTTTTDFVTFTKRGIVLPAGVAPAADCVTTWQGCLWWAGQQAGDNTFALPTSAATLYWPYAGKRRATQFSGLTGFAQGYLAKLDAQSIFGGAITSNPWTRIGATSGDSHLSWNGSAFTTHTTSQQITYGYSSASGNGQLLTWTGRRARVYAIENNTFGIASIWLDGAKVGTFDAAGWTNAETSECPVIAWDTGDLEPGSHTLEIRVTATKNANSTNTLVGVAYWEYI